MSGRHIRFSIFDWLDESGRGFAQTYEERLRMLEYADRAGFYCYHLAEHHGTALSSTPSPSVFLSAAAQRTHRLRLGALTWVLPLYEPLRLIEELSMLDQLSRGRIDVGVGRGSSPYEGMRHGLSMEESIAMYREALDILVGGWRNGELHYQGKHFNYDHVRLRLQPVQRPCPPLWYPTSSLDSIPWIAAQGFNTVFSIGLLGTFEKVQAMVRRYLAEWEAHRGDADRMNGHVADPICGITTHVYLAETDALACKQARGGILAWYENFVRRYLERGDTKYPATIDFENLVGEGRFLVGSPATVRERLRGWIEQSGANCFIGSFAFGNLPFESIMTSIDLFAKEVMPALSAAR